LIAGKAEPIITVTDALQSLCAVEAVRRSIATGKVVLLQDLATLNSQPEHLERTAS
jgi:hypothetical protein